MLNVSFNSEPTLAGLFDFVGGSALGNLNELPSGGGLTPGNNAPGSRLIQTDQPMDFRFQWTVSGIFTHITNPNFQWVIELFFERMGPGEFNIGGVGTRTLAWGSGTPAGTSVSFPGVGAPNSTTIHIPANTVPAGVYDIVAVVRLAHPITLQPCFLAAFAEYGKIEFYKEH